MSPCRTTDLFTRKGWHLARGETINNPLGRGLILTYKMFTEDEVKEFNTEFCKIGLTDAAEQKTILEFLYTFGTIAYNNIKIKNR